MPRQFATGARAPHLLEPWRENWFPVAFAMDLTIGALHRVTIFDRGYVLFHDDADNVACLPDRCPHRAARLSDGRLRDGKVECRYHGWQFDSAGICVHIPQLASNQPIPDLASTGAVPVTVRQGLVWVYGGAARDPDPAAIPSIDQARWEGCRSIDFAIDLPYGQEYLIENVLDFAHIHIAHDNVRGGGHRRRAGPLCFAVSDVDAGGFTARFGAQVDGGIDTGRDLASATVEFVAPNLVHYRSIYRDSDRCSGLALYSLPLAHGRCRLFYRAYSNFWPWRDRIRPRFWEHGYQCHLLEQDMAVLIGQAEEIRRSEAAPSAMWLPLKSSDTLVIRFRQWLDAYAAERPDYVGFHGRGPESSRPWQAGSIDRWTLHTRHCASCRLALRRVRLARRWFPALAFVLLAAACVAPREGSWRYLMVACALAALAASVAAAALCRRLAPA